MGQSQTQSKPQLTFDFTKRKRWADLLLTELVDNIVFVLSTQGKILYCGHAITELLGWKEVDLLDISFLELVDGEHSIFFFLFHFFKEKLPFSHRSSTLQGDLQRVTRDGHGIQHTPTISISNGHYRPTQVCSF